MRRRLTVTLAAAFAGGSVILAHAQAPAAPEPDVIVTKGGAVLGTGIGVGASAAGRRTPVIAGTGHIGAGTGGTGLGVGNATGGMKDRTRAGTGGRSDGASWGTGTGGIMPSGRGLDAWTGGIDDQIWYGQHTGGIQGSAIGSGVGGIDDLNSLAAGTGGIKEQNAQRFKVQ